MTLHIGISLMAVMMGALFVTVDCNQRVSKKLSPILRSVAEDHCLLLRRDCISSGSIFKRSMVCASNGKRFINACALQLRSCDLLRDTGEILIEERCFWIDKETEEEEGEGEGEEDEILPTTVRVTSSPIDTTSEYKQQTTLYGGYITIPGQRSTVVVDTFSTSENDHFMTTEEATTTSEYVDYSESYYAYSSYDSVHFRPVPGPIEENEGCSCRGDTVCPSCIKGQEGLGGKVCGTDGVTYATKCALDTERCDTENEDLYVAKEGSCAE